MVTEKILSSTGSDRPCDAVPDRLSCGHEATLSVVVAHPGRHHSHQLARALEEHGLLAKYVTGVPTHRGAGWWWARPLLRRYASTYEIRLRPALVTHVMVAPVASKLAAAILSRRAHNAFEHRATGWFDAYAARLIETWRPTVVVAYENAALRIFQRARQLGMITVLDAASFHHAWQDRFYEPVESQRAHRRIVARKDAELALADHVLTVSEYARESYLDAGAPPERVHAVPVGAAIEKFTVAGTEAAANDRMTRFVFVGHIDERKGVDILCTAARRLAAGGKQFELSVIGKQNSELCIDDVPGVKRLGWMAQDRLAQELRRYDALVLPSRHDSFGMVVAEAMASGLPVIVSDHVGAKEMVTHGANGFVVPTGDAAALASAMAWLIDHREALPGMRRAARATAERYRWEAYRERAVRTLRNIAELEASRRDKS
jgi:glycosyltransferase involved in cell wall biosynthesis